MADLISQEDGFEEQVLSDHPQRGTSIVRKADRPANIITKKFRVVCASCNNGWMSQLEEAARPMLTKMIRGKRFTMNSIEQLEVARWCALKFMIAEHGPETKPSTPIAARRTFMEDQSIPDFFRIYIGAHRSAGETGFYRRTATGALPGRGGPPNLEGVAANIQQSTFVMGRAFAHLNAVNIPGREIEQRFKMRKVHKFGRIWPPLVEKKKWPDKAVVSQNEFDRMASSWATVRNSPAVYWGGDLPTA